MSVCMFVCSSTGVSGRSWAAPSLSEDPQWRHFRGRLRRSAPSVSRRNTACRLRRPPRFSQHPTPSTTRRRKPAEGLHRHLHLNKSLLLLLLPPTPQLLPPNPNWSWWLTTGSRNKKRSWMFTERRRRRSRRSPIKKQILLILEKSEHKASSVGVLNTNWDLLIPQQVIIALWSRQTGKHTKRPTHPA